MTVDKFELHEQFGKALGYVKQGMQLLCYEDLQRLQTFACIEANLASWQQRYFELQDENERLHNSLLAKDELLQFIMQDVSITKELQNRLNCQESVINRMTEENEVFRQYIIELESAKARQDAAMKKMERENDSLQQLIVEIQSDMTCSDLITKAADDAKIITNLELEIHQWRTLYQERVVASSIQHQTDSDKVLQLVIGQSIEREEIDGSNRGITPSLADIETVSEVNQRIEHLRNEIDDLRAECESLSVQNSSLQDEFKSKAEQLSNLQPFERFDNVSCIQKNLQKVAGDLDSANLLLHEAKQLQATLQSANDDLRNELEIQKYRNDALDEVSRELAAKVQSGTVVDLHKFQQLEQEKQGLQTQLSDANSKRDLALQRLEESEARVQRLETKCQNLQESLDNDDQIRLRYRELFKELEESLSSNKRLKDSNQDFEDRLKKLKVELEAANTECDKAKQELQDVVENYRLFKERADEDNREKIQKLENLQLAFEKKSQLVEDLRTQLSDETARVAQAREHNDSLEEKRMSTNTALDNLKAEFDDIQSKFVRLRLENENLSSQLESIEVAKNTALDIVSSTRSQLMETESRENALKDANREESLQADLADMTEEMNLAVQERQTLESELSSKNVQCTNFEKELEKSAEQIRVMRQQIDSLKESFNSANLRHVEDAERIETLQTENKQVKMRLDKLEDMNKMLRQDLPASQSDDSAIEREKTKTKALSKQVTILKKKSKDLEKDCQRWKALYEKEIVGKTLQ